MHLDSQLEQQIAADPHATFDVIVRVEGDLDAVQPQLQADGFEIRRRFQLIRGFAARARGSNIQKAAHAAWIVSIEPDQEVRTM